MATLSKAEARTARARNGQRAAMKNRGCPACGRGNALTRHDHTQNVDKVASNCRYCPYVRLRGQTVADAVERARRDAPPVLPSAPMAKRGPKKTTGRSPGEGGKELRTWASAETYAACQAAAERAGLTVSGWLHTIAVEAATPPPAPPPPPADPTAR